MGWLVWWNGKWVPREECPLFQAIDAGAEQIALQRRQMAAERRRAQFRVITTEKVIHDGNS